MITGFFGSATAEAVRIFQGQQGLFATGAIDSATRSAIARVSCSGQGLYGQIGYGNVPTTYNYVNPFSYSSAYPYYNNNYNYSYPYNYGYTNPYPGPVAITSLSANTGVPGTSITIYGTGFDYTYNTVNFGGTQLGGLPSPSGTSLTFVVPSNVYSSSYAYGTGVQLSVTNSHGTSNALTFTLMGSYPYNYNYNNYYNNYDCTYGQSTWSPYGYNYGNNYCPPQTNMPTITYLSPPAGGTGTSVTVYGYGFSTTGNSVRFGVGIISNLGSPDGRSVSFIVPTQLTGYGTQPVTLGTYNVSVSNAAGYTSNTMPFTVTALGTGGAPTITNVSGPTSLSVGTQGVWTLTVGNQGNAYLSTSVRWGDEGVYGYAASAPQSTYAGSNMLSFSHTYQSAGTYTITFTVSNNIGQQNISSVTVNVSGYGGTGSMLLNYLSPVSGRVGTQVILQGSGFSLYDNTVHFGIGGQQHMPSYSGSTIYYTVPSYLTPCDTQPQGTMCAMLAQQVTPGTYPVYVTNSLGQTNTLSFTVVP